MTYLRQPVIGDQSGNTRATFNPGTNTVIKIPDGVYGDSNIAVQITVKDNQITDITQKNTSVAPADFLAILRSLPGWTGTTDYKALTIDGANNVVWKPVSIT